MRTQKLELIDLIYAAAVEPETGWPHLIEKFGSLFPETKTVLGTYEYGTVCFSRSATDIESSAIEKYAAHYAHINPVVPPLLKSKPYTYFDARSSVSCFTPVQ